jgi:hypothetical protein
MRERRLGCPVSCRFCSYGRASTAPNNIHGDYILYKDIIIQPKCMGIEVEVSFRRWVVRGLICRPGDIREVLSRLAILSIAEIIVIRWIHPHCTTIRHWRVADISW